MDDASPVPNIGSQQPEIDTLNLWHRNLADTLHRVIRKALKNKLILGVILDKKYFNIKIERAFGVRAILVSGPKCTRYDSRL